MKCVAFIILFLAVWPGSRVSAQDQAKPDTASYGNLMIFSNPVEAQIEIASLGINYPKTDQVTSIAYIPPNKYLVRVTAKKKMLEYEIDVKPYIESHVLFDLKKQKVTLLQEKRIIVKNR